MKQILQQIKQVLPENQVYEQELLKNHITFRVGGAADLFLEIGTPAQLQKLLQLFHETKTNYFVYL